MASSSIIAAALTLFTLLIIERFPQTLEYQILANKNLVKHKYIWKQQPLLHVQFKTFIKKLGLENFMVKHKRSKREDVNQTALIKRNFTKVTYQMPPMPVPMYVPPPMMIMPMRTVFEPVIHDHPPLHTIQKIIARDERKRSRGEWRPKYDSYSSSSSVSDEMSSGSTSGTSSSSTSTSDESAIDYYDTVNFVRG